MSNLVKIRYTSPSNDFVAWLTKFPTSSNLYWNPNGAPEAEDRAEVFREDEIVEGHKAWGYSFGSLMNRNYCELVPVGPITKLEV